MTTLPDRETALVISRTLVSEKLVACAQVLPPITSCFFWQGNLEEGEEHLLFLKTLEDRYSVLEDRLRALHPYAEPEIVALPIVQSSEGYRQWVQTTLA